MGRKFALKPLGLNGPKTDFRDTHRGGQIGRAIGALRARRPPNGTSCPCRVLNRQAAVNNELSRRLHRGGSGATSTLDMTTIRAINLRRTLVDTLHRTYPKQIRHLESRALDNRWVELQHERGDSHVGNSGWRNSNNLRCAISFLGSAEPSSTERSASILWSRCRTYVGAAATRAQLSGVGEELARSVFAGCRGGSLDVWSLGLTGPLFVEAQTSLTGRWIGRTVQPSGNALPLVLSSETRTETVWRVWLGAKLAPRQDYRKELESIGIAYDVADKQRTKTGRCRTR